MNYAQILPKLFVGSHPQTLDDLEKLRRESAVTAVLNLQTDEDMRAANLAWGPLEAQYRASGTELCRLPVRDFDPVDLREKLPECVRVLDRLLGAGHSVYLHCTAGTGRSPAVAVAYLYRCYRWDLDVAEAYVRERRPCSPNVEAIRLATWEPPDQRA